MEDVFGLLALAGYIIAIVGLAAGLTFLVIRVFPTKDRPDKPDKQDKAKSSDDGAGAGRLFRRAKREAAG